jgi:hypothetical protein
MMTASLRASATVAFFIPARAIAQLFRATPWRCHQQPCPPTFTFALNRDRLRKIRRGEGRYLLRTNVRR